MAERAVRFAAEGGTPPAPRVAATVVLLRAAPGGFEVYAIRRAATMAFGGMYAFPGGGVDPSDADAAVGWTGHPPSWWAERLGLAEAPARAVVCAAVREVFEEAGVLLAGPAPDAIVADAGEPHWETARQALAARRLSLTDLLAQEGLFLRSDLLVPWSRWITPEFEPRRFDTYFFLALLPSGQVTRDVSGEADHAIWLRPAEAAARYAAGELPMLPPTITTLRQLAEHPDAAAVLAAAARRSPGAPISPRIIHDSSGRPALTL